jgi:hypothetical protein
MDLELEIRSMLEDCEGLLASHDAVGVHLTDASARLRRLAAARDGLLEQAARLGPPQAASVANPETEQLLQDLNKWLAGFQAGVDAARDHLNEVEATVEVRLTETSALIDSIEERIGESLAAVEERAKTVGGQFDVAVQKASEAWKEVAGRAEDQIAESVSRLESELSAPLNVLARSVDEATEKLIDGVRGEWSPEALREVTQAVLAPLVAELEKAIDTLCEGIEGLCGSARDSGRQGDATRAELDNAVDTIKAAIDPLMNELQRLRDLAGSVGISI